MIVSLLRQCDGGGRLLPYSRFYIHGIQAVVLGTPYPYGMRDCYT